MPSILTTKSNPIKTKPTSPMPAPPALIWFLFAVTVTSQCQHENMPADSKKAGEGFQSEWRKSKLENQTDAFDRSKPNASTWRDLGCRTADWAPRPAAARQANNSDRVDVDLDPRFVSCRCRCRDHSLGLHWCKVRRHVRPAPDAA